MGKYGITVPDDSTSAALAEPRRGKYGSIVTTDPGTVVVPPIPDAQIAPTLEAAAARAQTHTPEDVSTTKFESDPNSIMSRRPPEKQAGKLEAAGRALVGTIPGSDLFMDERERVLAEKENPGTSGVAKTVGTVAPYLLPVMRSGGVVAQGLKAAALGGAQGAQTGARNGGGVEGALWGAGEGAATAGLLSGLAGAKAAAGAPTSARVAAWLANRAPGAVAVGSGATQALRNEHPGDVAQGLSTMALPTLGYIASRPGAASDKFTENALRAGREIERPGGLVDERVRDAGLAMQKAHGEDVKHYEGAADEARKNAVEVKTAQGMDVENYERANTDARKNALDLKTARDMDVENFERRGADARKGATDLLSAQEAQAKDFAAREEDARSSAVSVKTAQDMDKAHFESRGEEARKNALGLKSAQDEQAKDFASREADTRKHATDLLSAQEAQAKDFTDRQKAGQAGAEAINADLDSATRANRGAQRTAIGQIEGIHADVERAVASKADKIVAAARLKSGAAAYGEKIQKAFDRETAALDSELAALEHEQEGLSGRAGKAASKLHADTQAHVAGVLRLHDFLNEQAVSAGQPRVSYPPKLMERMARVTGHLMDTREGVTPGKLESYESFLKDPDAWKADWVQRRGAEGAQRIDQIEAEKGSRKAPDTNAIVAKWLMDKQAEAKAPKVERTPFMLERDGALPEIPKSLDRAKFVEEHRTGYPDMPPESLRPNPQPPPSDQVPAHLRPNPQPLPSDTAPGYLRPNHGPVPDDRGPEHLRPNPQPLPSDQAPEFLRPRHGDLPSDKAPDYLRPNHGPVPDDRPGIAPPKFDPAKASPTRDEVHEGLRADAKAGVDESLHGVSLVGQYARDRAAQKLDKIPLVGGRMGRFLASEIDPEKQVVGQYLARHPSDVAKDVKPGFNKAPEAQYVNERLAKATDFKALPSPESARRANAGSGAMATVADLMAMRERERKKKKAAK